MASRATRSGAVFSPYNVPPGPLPARAPEVIRCDIDLQDAVYKALKQSDLRAARYDNPQGPAYLLLDDHGQVVGDADSDSDADDWDDELEDFQSCASSPLTSPSSSPSPSSPSTSGVPSRAHSPVASGPLDASPTSVPGVHQRRRNEAANERRRKRRQRSAKQSPYEHEPSARYSQKHRELPPERAEFDAHQFSPSGSGAWLGARSSAPPNAGSSKRKGRRPPQKRLYTLPELFRMGCRLVRWNGKDPKLILDLHGRIVAILLGTPEDPDWDAVIADAVKEMAHARHRCIRHGIHRNAHPVHRRGRYVPLTAGGSLGSGRQRPGNLCSGPIQYRITRRLKRNPSVKRVMGFQSSGLATYAPKLYHYKSSTLKGVFEHHPHLKHNFSNSIFPAVTFNCGNAITFDHRDFLNLSHGLCGITSGGHFDSTLGGHIYLRQLKLVIEFPSGASILIPSGCVDHGNTPIQPGETRYSMTQYAAGGLFRWAAYGYQSAKSLLSKPGGAALKQAFDGEPGSRWAWALSLFSKYDELEADRAAIFGHA